MLCPCQNHHQNINKYTFEQCCQPIINKEKQANSPQALMRSRYSAYATKQGEYILNTYSNDSAKKQSLIDIQQWADNCKWVNLIIHNNSDQKNNEVEFSAYYIENKQLCMIRERSRFHLENSSWVYNDGDILRSMCFERVKRNDLCPCQSNKKFKACCNRYI